MAEKKEEMHDHTRKILHISEISMMLDSYDDIFSDFDPRPFSQRALSIDFLAETKRASRDKASGEIELKFLIPRHKRDLHDEGIIKKRLREHFLKHCERLRQEKKGIIKKGLAFSGVGVALMLLATYILFYVYDGFFVGFMVVLLEPAGWFLFWEGLNHIIYESKEKTPKLEFYEKMSKSEIAFLPY